MAEPEILEAVILAPARPRTAAPVTAGHDTATTFMCGMALGAFSALAGLGIVLAAL